VSFFELPARLYEHLGLHANRLCDFEQVGLMGFQETQQRSEQVGL